MNLNVGWSFPDLALVTIRSLCAISRVLVWSLVRNIAAKAYSNDRKPFLCQRVRALRFYINGEKGKLAPIEQGSPLYVGVTSHETNRVNEEKKEKKNKTKKRKIWEKKEKRVLER